MITLDTRTVLLVGLLATLASLAVVALLWRGNRDRFAGMAFWAADYAVTSIGALLVALRGVIPDWLSMVGGSGLVIAGSLLMLMGLERFLGKRGRQYHNYLVLALFITVQWYFAVNQPSLKMRTINIAAAMTIICFQCSWLLLKKTRFDQRPATRMLGLVFAAYCAVNTLRIAEWIVIPQESDDFLNSSVVEMLFLISYYLLLILMTYGLVHMVNGFLLADVSVQEEKFSRAFHSAPYAITLTGISDGRIFEVNRGFELVSGYTAAEARGKTTMDLHLWVNAGDRAAVMSTLAAGGAVWQMEFPFRKKSGEVITGLLSAETIKIGGEPALISSISDITGRKRDEITLKERLKELNCIYSITALLELQGIPLNEVMKQVVFLIPQAMFYPDIACARLAMGTSMVETERFQITPWIMGQDIRVAGAEYGRLEICYLEERSQIDEGPFMKEERRLINDIAERLGRYFEKVNAEDALRRRAKENESLLRASRAVLENREFAQSARIIFDLCKEVIGATAGYVALLSDTGDENEVLFLDSGGRPCTVDPNLPMPIRGLRGEAYASKKPVYDNDFHHSRWMEFMPSGHARLDNVMFAPLVIDGRAVGLIGLANKEGGFTGEDVRIAAAFGDIASIALLNSRTLEGLENAVKAKGLLLRELHHRVKNNLAMVEGFITLAMGDGTQDRETRILSETKDRVHTVAALYDLLHRSGDTGSIEITQYLHEIVETLNDSYWGKGSVVLSEQIGHSKMDANLAVYLGIMVNELVTNCFKHGMGADGRVDVRVSFTWRDGTAELTVADSGPGLPEGFDIGASESLGLKLVRLLTRQIRGRFDFRNDGGAVATVAFPADEGS